MSTIKLLDNDVINKIAAGEVVERPASVVKELTENAIDAGARQIRIELIKGGKELITVSDDGQGMTKGDLPLALTRHATSKIASPEDLFKLMSMGFRGEALASIGAVSRLTLSSKTSDQTGWSVSAEAESEFLTWSGPIGSSSGTTVVVENLFAKIPARLNFLKSEAAEFGAVQELLTQIALAHPKVGFELVHNKKSVFRWERCEDASSASTLLRCRQVFGADSADGLIEIKEENRFVKVSGFVSPPGVEKGTARFIFTFVNGRAIKDKNLRFALLRAYESHLLKGKSPVAVVNFAMDPALVDVNVHPAKTEVRFQYPLEVEGALVRAVRDTLRRGSWAVPKDLQTNDSQRSEAQTWPVVNESWVPQNNSVMQGFSGIGQTAIQVERPGMFSTGTTSGLASIERGSRQSFASAYAASAPPLVAPNVRAENSPGPSILWSEVEFLGTFSKLYLLFEWRDYLLVVDQHAFHERILFERFMKDPKLLGTSQRLLVPEVLHLDAQEMENLKRVESSLGRWGYDLAIMDAQAIEVRGVPALIKGRDVEALIHSLLNEHASDPEHQAEINMHHVIATAACHTAVRSGEELPPDELRELLRQASTVDFYHNCPHGRRVFSWWTRNDVAKLFDRPSTGFSLGRSSGTGFSGESLF